MLHNLTDEVKDLSIERISDHTKLDKMVYVLNKYLEWLGLQSNIYMVKDNPEWFSHIIIPSFNGDKNIDIKPKTYERII